MEKKDLFLDEKLKLSEDQKRKTVLSAHALMEKKAKRGSLSSLFGYFSWAVGAAAAGLVAIVGYEALKSEEDQGGVDVAKLPSWKDTTLTPEESKNLDQKPEVHTFNVALVKERELIEKVDLFDDFDVLEKWDGRV